jgi:hypothetical protein
MDRAAARIAENDRESLHADELRTAEHLVTGSIARAEAAADVLNRLPVVIVLTVLAHPSPYGTADHRVGPGAPS